MKEVNLCTDIIIQDMDVDTATIMVVEGMTTTIVIGVGVS